MILFQIVCPDVAARETRSVTLAEWENLPAGEYAFMEFYCDDLNCDCRRTLIEVWSRPQNGQVVAHINFGWERRSFYEKWSVASREAARKMARETTEAALDPIHPQAPYAPHLLRVFRQMIQMDPEYVARLKRHYDLFRKTLADAASAERSGKKRPKS
jgi:hypothetical protein